MVCRNIISVVKKILRWSKFLNLLIIKKIIDFIGYFKLNLKYLPKLIKENLNKFIFESKLKNIGRTNILFDDEEYN